MTETAPRWRLRYHFGDLELFSAWEADLAAVENLAEQFQRDQAFHDVVIERRTTIQPGDHSETGSDEKVVMTDGGTVAANGGTSDRFPELADIHRDILLTLARSGPTHGRGLMDDLATLRDEDITDSHLYRNLGNLDALGLVEIREHVHDDRSHEYALTAQGRSAVREHAQRLEGAVAALEESDR
jgi:DNA-binding PadR family transcriptional regulator